VPVFSDSAWKVEWNGIPIPRVIDAPANSQPWGSVLPGTSAHWVYIRDFKTGAVRDNGNPTAVTFRKILGSQLNVSHLESARVRIAADNGFALRVNGRRIASTFDESSRRWSIDPIHDWNQVRTYDIASALVTPGTNEMEVTVYDLGTYAGFLLDAAICARQGYSQAVPRGSADGPVPTIGAGSAPPAGTRFDHPKTRAGYALDNCLTYATDCGQPAADAFCRQQGFAAALKDPDGFAVEKSQLTTQPIAETGRTCRPGNGFPCNTFTWVSCRR
jgi:hypothetical protein